MPRLAAVLICLLAGCSLFETDSEIGANDMAGWRYVSGKTPSRGEYTAMVAACQDGAVHQAPGSSLDACLAGLGLKRAP